MARRHSQVVTINVTVRFCITMRQSRMPSPSVPLNTQQQSVTLTPVSPIPLSPACYHYHAQYHQNYRYHYLTITIISVLSQIPLSHSRTITKFLVLKTANFSYFTNTVPLSSQRHADHHHDPCTVSPPPTITPDSHYIEAFHYHHHSSTTSLTNICIPITQALCQHGTTPVPSLQYHQHQQHPV